MKGTAVDLGSERDATFLIDDGGDGAVLKISNLGEDPAVLDLEHTPRLRPLLAAIDAADRRAVVERVLDAFEERVAPRWARLRGQVVHADFTLGNVLLDDDDRVAAIVDFGDCAYSAQVADFAVDLASLLRGRAPDDVFRVGRIAVDGYASRLPLEPDELAVLGYLVAARLAMIVAISAWRVRRYPENAEYIQAEDEDSWTLLEHFDGFGLDAVARELGARAAEVSTDELVRRRADTLGALLTPLTYTRPVHVVRGEGVWLYEADGSRVLDAYNNVPVVGHCHPRVTEAVVRQTRALNTHARYLYEPLVALAERLLATLPPEAGLDTVMLVNSGSEANDIAWRIATAVTGSRGAIVTDHAYHGVTDAIADLSPEEWPPGHRPANVTRIQPPDLVAPELEGLAATFLDCGLTSDGIYTLAGDAIAALVDRTHDAGGLFVADEVQAGYGRLGEHLWSFAGYGVTPDIVTLGKPMGNGYPVAAVITRREIVESFPVAGEIFSTFGGNPVAAQAALAVLDVIEDERLVAHAATIGAQLLAELRKLSLDVRGCGLLVGVQLSTPQLAARTVDRLREAGILIGRTGPLGDVLKLRPPLVFAEEHVTLLVEALNQAPQSAAQV